MKNKLLLALTLSFACALPPKRLNKIDLSLIDTTKVTNDISVQNSALGGCTCDVTFNSCDAYCCCDTDCSKEVRDYWNQNSNSFCAKNFIGSTIKPTQKCIDKG